MFVWGVFCFITYSFPKTEQVSTICVFCRTPCNIEVVWSPWYLLSWWRCEIKTKKQHSEYEFREFRLAPPSMVHCTTNKIISKTRKNETRNQHIDVLVHRWFTNKCANIFWGLLIFWFSRARAQTPGPQNWRGPSVRVQSLRNFLGPGPGPAHWKNTKIRNPKVYLHIYR